VGARSQELRVVAALARLTLLVLVAPFVSLAAGCAPRPRTQVMVVVTAETDVSATAERVRVRVLGGDDEALVERALQDVGTELTPVRFPVLVAIVPADGLASRRFEVQATALDGEGREVSRARVVSSFVSGRTLRLELRLWGCCASVTCPETQTCRACACVPVEVPPETLEDYVADAGPPPPPDAAPGDAPAPDAAVPPACSGSCFRLSDLFGGLNIAPWPRDGTWAPPVGGCPATATAPTSDHGFGSFQLHNDTASSRTLRLTTMREPPPDPSVDLALVVYDLPAPTADAALLPADRLACRAYSDDAPTLAPDAQLEVTLAPDTTILVVITRATPGMVVTPGVQVGVEPVR
jgi:hypothetical protein